MLYCKYAVYLCEFNLMCRRRGFLENAENYKNSYEGRFEFLSEISC
jgi:hypothetical protein